MSAEILIIDDEQDIRTLIQGILEDEGYETRLAGTDQDAYKALDDKRPDLVILDIWLKNSTDDGIAILKNIKKRYADLPVLMISGHGTIETAVSALKIGAYDFIEKPFKSDRLLLMIERALETASLRTENKNLKSRIEGPSDLIGTSPSMTSLRNTLEKVAQTNSRLLITGEPGTGKDVAARYVHKSSKRGHQAFVTLNCATMLPERLEIELFGTAPDYREEPNYKGVLERADGGTLFLDEVADMPLETQGKIVRVLQEQRFQRVGGHEEIAVDVRVIASTNRDLQKEMDEGNFRQDLYYRLNVVPIDMPPLRDHPEDIPALTVYFAQQYSLQSGIPACDCTPNCLRAMELYEWPGNVRELRNAIERMMIVTGGGEVSDPAQISPAVAGKSQEGGSSESAERTDEKRFMALQLREAREAFESNYLAAQLDRFAGNISKTAEFVGMERSALHRKLKQLGISTTSKQNDGDSPESESATAPDENGNGNTSNSNETRKRA